MRVYKFGIDLRGGIEEGKCMINQNSGCMEKSFETYYLVNQF